MSSITTNSTVLKEPKEQKESVLEQIDWSLRNNPVARLEGDLRAMPKNIIERIKTVEKLLGKFPAIVLVDDQDTRTSYYETQRELIHINKNLSYNKQLAYLLFEVLNAARIDDFGGVCGEAIHGKHTEKSFGEAFEKIEFENMIEHHRLVEGLPRECDIYRRVRSMSLEEYLLSQQASGHTERYRRCYRESGYRYLGAQATP